MLDLIIKENIRLLDLLRTNQNLTYNIEKAIELISSTINKNLPILIFGNGGSASDALHITGELVGRFLIERRAINIICLNSNVSVLTAWSNDYSYESVFERQVEAHFQKNGVCWGISTSGNSINVIKALQKAKDLNMHTIGLTGKAGGNTKSFSDILIDVPSEETPRIQELHLLIYHYMCEEIEKNII